MNNLIKNTIRKGIEELIPYSSSRNEANYGSEI
jgi:hypothetical protein